MKVAVIGGGICGLYLAKNLAEKQNEVTVFERKTNIGKPGSQRHHKLQK